VITERILQLGPDEHVFIMIECEDRPTISLDLANLHGRRCLSIRVNGMTIGSSLLDVEELPTLTTRLKRWCPFCGEEIEHL